MSLGKRYLDLAEYVIDFLKTTPSNLWSSEAENLLAEFISLGEQTYSKMKNKQKKILYLGASKDVLFSVKTSLLISDLVIFQDTFLSSLLPKMAKKEIKDQKSIGYYLQLYSSIIEPIKEYIVSDYVYFVPNFNFPLLPISEIPQLRLELINRSLRAFSDDTFKSLLYAHNYNWPLFTDDKALIDSLLTKLSNEVIPFFDFLRDFGANSYVSLYNFHQLIKQLKKYSNYFEVIFNLDSIRSTIDSIGFNELLSCKKCIELERLINILRSYDPNIEKDFLIALLEWLEDVVDKNPDWRIDILRILSTYSFSLMYNISPLLSFASPFISTIVDIPQMAEEFLDALEILHKSYTKNVTNERVTYLIGSSFSLSEKEYLTDIEYINYFKEAYAKNPKYFESLSELLSEKQ